MAEQQRIVALDLARTAALAGMVIFHFARDLEMFGAVPAGMTQTGLWPVFARIVAGAFLLLAGASLYLAHGRGIRWQAFWRRLAMIAAGAALVTLATRAAMPGSFIFFGILHAIAAFSLIGLLFLRLPVALIWGSAALVWMAPLVLRNEAFNVPWLLWLGLSTTVPPTLDFEPLFPWFAPFLFGLGLARFASLRGLLSRPRPEPGPLEQALARPGRHSLAIYLAHQPILVGLLWLWFRLMP